MSYFLRHILPQISVFGAFAGGIIWLVKYVLDILLKSVPTYLNEKAKNLATKEDISGITQQVEKIKQEFAAKTEELRAELQYHGQIRLSIKTEERNAIVNCYEKYHLWLNLLTGLNGPGLKNDSLGLVQKSIEQIDLAYQSVQLAEAKMLLYIGPGEYMKIYNTLKIKTLILSNEALEFLEHYRYAIESYQLNLSFLTEQQHDERRELNSSKYTEVESLIKNYRKSMLEKYKEIVNIENNWRDKSLEKLTALAS